MAAGFAHLCLRIPNGTFCLGADDYGQSTVPKDLDVNLGAGTLSAGGHHTCAIDSKLGVRCWGQNKYGQVDVPKNIVNARQITSGFAHNCVLDDGGVKCWGRNDEGQLQVPQLKNPTSVRAGGYHTCAIDDNGAHCWGDNSFGQANVPEKIASHISVLTTGYLHTCGVIK